MSQVKKRNSANPSLSLWMNAAKPQEIKDLAAKAKTSVGHLYHLKLGNRVAGPELAKRIELASVPISAKSDGRLPNLSRVGMCPACSVCEFAKLHG